MKFFHSLNYFFTRFLLYVFKRLWTKDCLNQEMVIDTFQCLLEGYIAWIAKVDRNITKPYILKRGGGA